MRRDILTIKNALALIFVLTFSVSCGGPDVFDVREKGAVGDGITDCTSAVNSSIEECSAAGGRVLIPQGRYLCRTIHLKDNVELYLDEGAVIVGVENPELYDSFIPEHDLSRFDSGDGTVNANNSKDARWNRALIIGNGVKNVSIRGAGEIDGRHVFDSLGEEHMRGPHAVLLAESENVCIEGITIRRASNYAVMGYALKQARFEDIHVMEGWDGVHVRGCESLLVKNCDFETGDDCIAGGYWKDALIKGCSINTSCNGLRMIMPSEDVIVRDCSFFGPGKYPHKTSGRTNMLYAVTLEPGAWGRAEGEMKNIVLRDLEISGVYAPFETSVRDGSVGRDLTIKNVVATGVYGTAAPLVSRKDNGFETVRIRSFDVR